MNEAQREKEEIEEIYQNINSRDGCGYGSGVLISGVGIIQVYFYPSDDIDALVLERNRFFFENEVKRKINEIINYAQKQLTEEEENE